MEEKITARLEQAVSARVFPGCVVGIVDRLEKQTIISVGNETYDDDASPVTASSIYDIASITKVIPVASLALHLIDTTKLSLHRPVVEILPELQTNYLEDITVWHLLTQTLAFRTSLASLKEQKPEEILHEILTTQFALPPGQKGNYSNASSILLGMVIERTTGKSLDEVADTIFFKPLGMHDTSFHPDRFPLERIIPTERDMWRKRTIKGEIHDESAYRLREKMIPGSAGLFSTVPDLLTFIQMLLQKGIYNGKRYFSEEMIMSMTENELEAIGDVGGLGWELNQSRYMGEHISKRTIGKTGFTGCVVVVDIEQGKGLVILSNYHYPIRKLPKASELHTLRRNIADIVFTTT